MVDINSQIQYWQRGAWEDFEIAADLVNRKKLRHGLFFTHLSIEKILKALVCKATGKLAPRIHNLVRLSELTELNFSQDIIDLFADINDFNLEGRYPIQHMPEISFEEANNYILKSKEVMEWLTSQL